MPRIDEASKVEFGQRLQRHMLDRGWNQSELARQAERHMPEGKRFGRDAISLYVQGRSFPGPVHLQALTAALKVDARELVPDEAVTSRPLRSSFEIRDIGDGKVWLRVDQAVPVQRALKVMELLSHCGQTSDPA
jgi:transcriptional regulator with XRE-family HTH domain